MAGHLLSIQLYRRPPGTSATYYNPQPLPEISLREGRIRTRSEAASAWLAASVAGLLPVLFIPVTVDGFILPRAVLALTGGAVGWGRLLTGYYGHLRKRIAC